MKLWFFHEFSHLFEPYGQVLALDHATAEYTDFRIARVRVGFCDTVKLPPMHWITYCDPNGFWTRYNISMEVEQGRFVPPPPPPPFHTSQVQGVLVVGTDLRGKGR
jgi:hypothetical protein